MSVNLLIMLLIVVFPFIHVLVGFLCQPVRFNKSVHKHISSSVVNKPTPSVDASETLCAKVKCKNKFCDV